MAPGSHRYALVQSEVKRAAVATAPWAAPSGPFALATRTDNTVRELSLQQGHSPVLTGDQLRTRSDAGEIDADAELDAMRVAMLLPVAG